jgi:hypothetical protein
MAFQKNAKQSTALAALAKKHNLPVRDLMLSDTHCDAVCEIFYEGLPKLARMAMNREKFKVFYTNQREKLADQMFPMAAA